MVTNLELAGLLMMALALFHLGFPRFFRWREELARLSRVNREIHMVHTFFVALTVFLMGLLCWTSAGSLLTAGLGRRICLGLAAFWLCRLLIQFAGYSAELWRGKRFETAMHVLFAALWLYLSLTFLWAGLGW